MVLAHAATQRQGERENKKLIGCYDVSVAFFHAEATGKIAVVPPKGVDEGHLWYLLKSHATGTTSWPPALRKPWTSLMRS